MRMAYIAWQLSYLVTSDWTFINKSQVDWSANTGSEFITSTVGTGT